MFARSGCHISITVSRKNIYNTKHEIALPVCNRHIHASRAISANACPYMNTRYIIYHMLDSDAFDGKS